MRELFGTDGIRGMANVHPMTIEVAMQAGRAVAYLFREGKNKRRHRVLIGKDTRLSCYMLENAITAGVCSMGVDVLLVGPMPTPAISFLTGSMRADAGIVISASHNPYHDNGIKLFSRDGFKLPDHQEARIEELMDSDTLAEHQPTGRDVGKAFRIDDARGRYIVFLKHTFPKELTLDGLKIVLDCANGATYGVAPLVFEELGADVVKTGVSPNGININDGCGALYPEALKHAVLEHDADMGVALDGDGDRLIVVDEKGNIVDGDHIMAICAKYMIENRTLNYNTVVATVMSNMGLDIALQGLGGRLVRTDVGDRYVVEAMREKGYNFGGEQSGHLIFLDYITTGDGILAALQLLTVMQRTRRPLSELQTVMENFPQTLVNVKVSERREVHEIEGLSGVIEAFEKEFEGKGRILVRPSGTEPLLRVMVEGDNEERINHVAAELADFITARCAA
jgi:phosphoglucosamine mutase